MSDDKKSSLGDFVNNIRSGFTGLKATAKSKPEPAEPTLAEEFAEANTENPDSINQTDLRDDLLTDQSNAEVVDAGKPKRSGGLKGLSAKKKIMLGVVVLIAVVLVKNAALAPRDSVVPAAAESKLSENGPEIPINFGNGDSTKGEGSGLASLTSPLGDQPKLDDAVGKSLDDLNLNGQLRGKETKSNLPVAISTTAEAAPVDAFGFPSAPENTAKVAKPDAASSNGLPANLASEPAASSTTVSTANKNTGDKIGADVMTEPNPFVSQNLAPVTTTEDSLGAPTGLGKPDPVLAGTQLTNPDSSTKPRLQGNTGAEQASIGAQLKAKDEQIKSLEKQLKLAKNDAHTKRASKAAKPSSRAPSKHSTTIAKKTTPQVTPVATFSPRPKVCVKAVAPAARNCSTCVAHAFIVDSGAENMVGQGDFIHGYRVSITGDRLDLQDSNGEVKHKFWSQPNGCAAF